MSFSATIDLRPKVIELFFMLNSAEHEICHAHYNVKMPTIVPYVTFISMTNTPPESLKARKSLIFSNEVFMSS